MATENNAEKGSMLIGERNITIAEAVDYLKVSKSTLYKLTSSAKITFQKPNGGKIYFTRENLDQWLLQNESKSVVDRQEEINSKIYKNGK